MESGGDKWTASPPSRDLPDYLHAHHTGISITSTALTFEYAGIQINLLDTPGHQDFSEDTYRTLAAADNAVMLVDGAKGIEPQTRKLFEVWGDLLWNVE